MSKVLDINLNKASLHDKISDFIGSPSDVYFKNTTIGNALLFNNLSGLYDYGALANVKTLVFVINPKSDTKLFKDNGTDKLEISASTITATGLTENYKFITEEENTNTVSLNTWQLIISEFSAGISFLTDFQIETTADIYIGGSILAFDTILSQSERIVLYKEFLNLGILAATKFNFLNENAGDITFTDNFKYEPADNTVFTPEAWIKSTGTFNLIQEGNIDPVLTEITPESKILSCVTAGKIGVPTTQRTGTYEFIIRKSGFSGTNAINIKFPKEPIYQTSIVYFEINISATGQLVCTQRSGATYMLLLSNDGFIEDDKFYKLKLIVDASNQCYLYIKGGKAGSSYILADSSGGGSNPFSLIIGLAHSHIEFDIDSGDKIAEVKLTKENDKNKRHKRLRYYLCKQ